MAINLINSTHMLVNVRTRFSHQKNDIFNNVFFGCMHAFLTQTKYLSLFLYINKYICIINKQLEIADLLPNPV